ncbi:cytochrome P450 [Biscogniauxia marginata]|nr:cytochrome P450 [Biscogniauxia marginata]
MMNIIAFIFIYRVTLHPLSRYPGPLIAKFSDWYGTYYALRMRLHTVTRHDHLKYGPIIRHGPNKLVFSTLRELHGIYDSDRIVKSHACLVTVNPPNYCVFNVIDQPSHRVKRKLIVQVVSERSMRIFEPTMEQIDIFIQQLLQSTQNSEAPRPLNMTPLAKSLGLDIVCLLAFGYPLNTQTAATNHHIRDGIPAVFHLFTDARQRRMRYQKTIEHLVNSRVAEDKNARHDLYSMAADAVDAQEIRASEIWAEALFFFLAGGDKVATGLSALFFYLSRNTECYTKLCREIRTTFPSSTELRGGPRLASCRYLRACIDEALRMSPLVAGTLWREQSETDNSPLFVDGHFIPRGTQVGMNIYTLHHNEEYFPDPVMHDAFVPFSIEYRGCAGKAMAYLEFSLAMTKTLWYFDFEVAPGKLGYIGAGRDRADEFQLFDVFASTHDGPYLVFRPRDDFCHDLLSKSP